MRMATETKRWTLEELHSLPDDGNKYELVYGELFVTPAPTPNHEAILARLSQRLVQYVVEQKLGTVFHPRAVVRFEGLEVEPDLFVRPAGGSPTPRWEDAPAPLLVVEVLSPYTRRRDHMQKRDFYLEAGVAEYWIVDPERKSVRIVRSGQEDTVTTDDVRWLPPGATEPFACHTSDLFSE